MTTELFNRKLWLYILQVATGAIVIIGLIAGTNYLIDSSDVIRPGALKRMAKLSLSGETVSTPLNYNERLYQEIVINEMEIIPETIVIGSSRGLFLGKDVTGYEDIYNNCVSGSSIEDYYAILGLYLQKFGELPSRIIIETSPWIFYRDNPEARWMDNNGYKYAAGVLYQKVNKSRLDKSVSKENPYLSLPYFQYNLRLFRQEGRNALVKEEIKKSDNDLERAEFPDGTIRYDVDSERQNPKRLSVVTEAKGAVTYENSDKMTELDDQKIQEYDSLVSYLLEQGVEIIVYMAPFSATQSYYSFDKKLNIVFKDVERYLYNYRSNGIGVVGGYDARDFDLTDEYFIDRNHIDKEGTNMVWNYHLN